MRTLNRGLCVNLLLVDVAQAGMISKSLRKTGVIAQYFETLEDFWHSVNSKCPTLAIIDVRLMSQGELVLKNHPLVKQNKIPLVFYYNQKSRPLLTSTYEITHFGVLKEAVSYDHQLKIVLDRLNRFLLLESENVHLQKQVDRTKSKALEFLSSINKQKEVENFQRALKELMDKFECIEDEYEFQAALKVVMESWAPLESYSLYQLSPNKLKLECASIRGEKYKKLPPLWLGKKVESGIEFFAQNMAIQVGMDILGHDVITMKILGGNRLPEIILFLKVDWELGRHLDWNFLEKFLTGYYSRKKLQSIQNNQALDLSIIHSWDLMEYLDLNFKGESSREYGLLDINFSGLLEEIKIRINSNFYWKEFISDFLSLLEKRFSQFEMKISLFGIHHVGLLVGSKESSEIFEQLKVFTREFSYWRYFEESESLLGNTITPIVKMIPVSSSSYLRYVENSYEGLERALERNRNNGMISQMERPVHEI